MLWKESWTVQLRSFSMNHILCTVQDEDGGEMWDYSGIYRWPDTNNKRKTWQLLKAIHRSIGKPWICTGDFNEILWHEEKKGGSIKTEAAMGYFRDALYRCGLSDLGYNGMKFTWTNGRRGKENVMERLDRAVANRSWKERFPHTKVTHLPRY